jgi:hypothetical protein
VNANKEGVMASDMESSNPVDDDILALRKELEELELSAQIAEMKARITEANVRNLKAQLELGTIRAEVAERRREAVVNAS